MPASHQSITGLGEKLADYHNSAVITPSNFKIPNKPPIKAPSIESQEGMQKHDAEG